MMSLARSTFASFLALASMTPAAQPNAPSALKPTLALVGGQVIDGYEGPPIRDGVVLIAGERIVAVGTRAEVSVPPGTPVINTEGMRVFPERLDDPLWQEGLPKDIVKDIRDSLKNLTHLDYFTLTFRRIPTLQRKFQQLRETGVTMIVGTDSGIPANFHTDSTWRELDTWVKFGMTPMQAIGAATRWPARFLKQEKNLGTLAAGRLADVIAVRGDVLSNVTLLQNVPIVVKGGVRVK